MSRRSGSGLVSGSTSGLRDPGRRTRGPSPTAWTLTLAALAAGLSFALWTVYASPLFEVDDVAVSGASLVPVARIEQAAGRTSGVPLARIDAEEIRRQVAQLPQLATVRVRREWPHTLRLEVVERTAVFRIVVGEDLQYVDGTGTVFPAPRSPSMDALPLLRADTRRSATAYRAGAAAVLGVLPAPVRAGSTVVELTGSGRVTLVLRDGRRVVWGEPGESGRKSEVLGWLLELRAEVYDVSVPGAPTTR